MKFMYNYAVVTLTSFMQLSVMDEEWLLCLLMPLTISTELLFLIWKVMPNVLLHFFSVIVPVGGGYKLFVQVIPQGQWKMMPP